MNTGSGLLGIDEVVEYLGLSKSTIYKMAASGRLPGHKLGKHWRFRQSAIDAWLDAKTGLSARSLEQSPTRSTSSPQPLTLDQGDLLKGMWVDRPEQFIAIAATPDGRTSLAKLLGLTPEKIDGIARALRSSPDLWPRSTTSESR